MIQATSSPSVAYRSIAEPAMGMMERIPNSRARQRQRVPARRTESYGRTSVESGCLAGQHENPRANDAPIPRVMRLTGPASA